VAPRMRCVRLRQRSTALAMLVPLLLTACGHGVRAAASSTSRPETETTLGQASQLKASASSGSLAASGEAARPAPTTMTSREPTSTLGTDLSAGTPETTISTLLVTTPGSFSDSTFDITSEADAKQWAAPADPLTLTDSTKTTYDIFDNEGSGTPPSSHAGLLDVVAIQPSSDIRQMGPVEVVSMGDVQLDEGLTRDRPSADVLPEAEPVVVRGSAGDEAVVEMAGSHQEACLLVWSESAGGQSALELRSLERPFELLQQQPGCIHRRARHYRLGLLRVRSFDDVTAFRPPVGAGRW